MNHRKGLYVSNCECDECEKYREAIALGRNQGNAVPQPRTKAEGLAKADYLAVLGKIVTVKMLSAYNEHDDSIDFDGVECRVRVTSTSDDDLSHWVDEYLDPYWNVEPINIEDIPDIAGQGGLRSWWTFGPSYRIVNGEVLPVDNNQSTPHAQEGR